MTRRIIGKSGKWYDLPTYEGCCDCGLVHKKEYQISVKGIDLNLLVKQHKVSIKGYFRAWRDEKRTKINRKRMGYEKKDTKN